MILGKISILILDANKIRRLNLALWMFTMGYGAISDMASDNKPQRSQRCQSFTPCSSKLQWQPGWHTLSCRVTWDCVWHEMLSIITAHTMYLLKNKAFRGVHVHTTHFAHALKVKNKVLGGGGGGGGGDIKGEITQYHSCWRPDSSCRQIISNHGIDSVGSYGHTSFDSNHTCDVQQSLSHASHFGSWSVIIR